ncbi:hypothetical protein FRB91_011156 [Serendipita sp. 411]|nr:hypothetical protein FRC19_008281 [Serendipita sp. 401]KAG8837115.1 hypothetical protein FRC18_010031 [Serendipita sp. 400]KAG8857558.1 hypothetical protein FRB91_011156 [Serendipita sp. 411]KAG9053736.1 hypothetical protein FS842_007318 [Serendipita sp. 407]
MGSCLSSSKNNNYLPVSQADRTDVGQKQQNQSAVGIVQTGQLSGFGTFSPSMQHQQTPYADPGPYSPTTPPVNPRPYQSSTSGWNDPPAALFNKRA